ncbi:MAG: prepilin-type N-terminal cleavage/methylation domain-containing protein [Phycisphaerae bacterium]
MKRETRRNARQGFTLLEVAIATVILAIGIVALLTASASSTAVNAAGSDLTQATFLAQEIREYCAGLDPCEVALSDSYTPPVNARLQTLSDLTGWKQTITMQYKDPNGLTDSATPTDVRYVKVEVSKDGTEILETSWLVTKTK